MKSCPSYEVKDDGIACRSTPLAWGCASSTYPGISVFNCAPALLRAWGIRPHGSHLEVSVTHRLPGAIMGSGLGKNTIWRGAYDIQLFDPVVRRRYRLESLRFGDMAAILGANVRFGPSARQDRVTIGGHCPRR